MTLGTRNVGGHGTGKMGAESEKSYFGGPQPHVSTVWPGGSSLCRPGTPLGVFPRHQPHPERAPTYRCGGGAQGLWRVAGSHVRLTLQLRHRTRLQPRQGPGPEGRATEGTKSPGNSDFFPRPAGGAGGKEPPRGRRPPPTRTPCPHPAPPARLARGSLLPLSPWLEGQGTQRGTQPGVAFVWGAPNRMQVSGGGGWHSTPRGWGGPVRRDGRLKARSRAQDTGGSV